MKEVWVDCFISYFPSFISSHFINKFLLIKVPQFDFKIWERRLFFSHLTTSISITYHCKSCCILQMMSRFKKSSGNKAPFNKVGSGTAMTEKVPFPQFEKTHKGAVLHVGLMQIRWLLNMPWEGQDHQGWCRLVICHNVGGTAQGSSPWVTSISML